jgi:hypothetical protein
MSTVSTTDKVGTKSPQLAAATLVLYPPDGARALTIRADGTDTTPTYACYALSSISVGAQSAGNGSRKFDLGGDEPIPCFGLKALYFALDAGLANWNYVFTIG